MPDPEVLTYVAERVTTNIRELEGALTRVVAFSSLTGRPMTVELAEDVLKDVFPQGQSVEISIRRIQETVSERFGMTVNELCSAKRSQSIAYPRQVAMYLSRALTDSSLPKIGKEFGGRDHHRHAREREDRGDDPRGSLCVQPCAGADGTDQAGRLISVGTSKH